MEKQEHQRGDASGPDRLRPLPPALAAKLAALRAAFREMGSAAIAFSAGADSTLLAAVAAEELGARALAVTAASPAFPKRELDEALALARALGIRHRIVRSDELGNPDYASNPADRCYHCKTELYALLRRLADEEGLAAVADGANADDLGDYRPGRRAAGEKGVRSPLAELGFTKDEIREVSRSLGLSTADKPALACLASRFPYGERITAERLRAVERAEDALRDMGFRQLRVRVHGDIARIELPPSDLAAAVEARGRIADALKACGFRYVTLDLQGYRRGSLNEALKAPPAASP